MAHRSTARTKGGGGGGLTGWKSWKKEIDEVDRRQAAQSLQQILFGVWGSGVYVSQDLEEKLLPWEKEWKEKERERDASGCVGH